MPRTARMFAVLKGDAVVSQRCEGWLYEQKYSQTSASRCLREDIIQTQTRQALNKHVSIRAAQQADIEKTLQLVQLMPPSREALC